MAKQDGPGPEKTKREEARRRRKAPTRTTTTELNSRTKGGKAARRNDAYRSHEFLHTDPAENVRVR